ncbi:MULTISPECIES: secretin N-terminal domain-containing protein [unclassified Deinococcus]|uniref:secretin N-terminal domain-containing protein n=1 Tax=unclassified Deinococcus TaxID=2623546 RepID=UPI001E457B71|nr:MULTISPECIES: secretin N-terminal domain-containing protein [unclassified Deinococcus]MCD0161545.1 secretin [Deinococcus sp. 6YEL10]MCD0169513.1 secretin [Deinococcus sp. 23YEL01]
MTKRFAFLLLTAALGMAAAQTSTPAAPVTQASASADPALTPANVTIEIGRYGGPLSSLLSALAKSAGYGLILDTNVDALPSAAGTATPTTEAGTSTAGTPAATGTARPVVYSFQNKPFNEVWPLLMDVYGLSYDVVRLSGEPVLRVSNTPIQRSVTLKNADATQASQQVKLFFGTPTYSETPQRDAQGNTTGVLRTLADVKLDSATLRIIPDVRSNSVIIRGTNKEVAEVTRLLGQLDSTPGAGTSTTTTETQTVQRVYAVKGAQADIVAVLAAQYPGLKVTPVGQTGQLVITGPQNQLDAAVTLLGQVDRVAPVVAGAQITQRVFQLVNASAEEVKATLEGTLARELSTGSIVPNATLIDPTTGQPYTTGALANAPLNPTSSTAGTGTAATDTRAATASIIADKRTNTLIVRGTADQVAQVADLIPNLDQRVPQINVQVRIQEITETASRSLGMDWKAGFGGFTVSAGSGGLGAAFDPTRSLVGFNLGATLNTLQGQGLSKSVYDGAITMQSGQRSLGSGTSTQNASGSAAATIKSGGRLELNIPSTAANVAPIQKQIDYGVNLDFFDPQVAPDGTITMRVRGQINDLRTTITAATVPNLLQFVNSEAQTTLTFKNGETLLLSGLLKTTESNNRDGVPFLSTIPVIGGLFGREATKREQTQLLVVITGTVVK